MFHFVLTSGIISLGKGFDEVFEQGGSSHRDGMVPHGNSSTYCTQFLMRLPCTHCR